MADPTFEAALRQAEAQANQTTSTPASPFEQQLRAAEQQAMQPTGVNAPPAAVTATPRMDAQGLYSRRDAQGQPIPLDQDTGFMPGVELAPEASGFVPVGQYWRLSQQSDPEAQAEVLRKMFPNRAVRILDTGDVTLEVTDSKTGKSKDVMLNPRGVDAHDLFDLAATAPEIAAQMAVAISLGGWARGALKTGAQIIAAGLAGGAAGGARDVVSRKAEGIPVRMGDITRQRSGETILGMGGETLLGGLGKASRVFSPLARKKGVLAFDQEAGMDALREGYGVNLRATPGERTGSKMLQAVEAAESPMPGSRGVFDAFRDERNAQLQEVQRVATQGLLPEEEIGRQAQEQLLWRSVAPVEQAFNTVRQQARESGNREVLRLMNEVAGRPGTRVTPTEAGGAAREAFERRVIRGNAARDEAYARVNAIPGGSGDVLPGDAAADAAAEIRAQLPGVLRETEQATGLVDDAGQPLTRTVEERAALRGNEPAGLEAALRDMEALRGGRVSLQTLTELKNRAHDAIAAFRTAHGDTKDRWFSRIAGGFENTIQAGIDSTGDLELRNALVNARRVYREEVLPLERPGIRELAKDEFDAGQLSREQIVSHFFEGPKAIDNLAKLTEVLGQDNVAVRSMRRAWLDTKLMEFADPTTQLINPTKLGDLIQDMEAKRPELAQFMFGRNAERLGHELRVQSALDRTGLKKGIQSIDETELRTLLALPNPSVDDLKAVMRIGANRDRVYANKILEDIRDNTLSGDFQPTRFVKSLRNTDIPTEHVQQALSTLDTPTRDAIATAEFYRILNEATERTGETVTQRATGQPGNLSPTKLVQALGKTPAERARTSLLLGDDLPSPGARPPRKAASGEPQEAGLNREQTLLAIVKTLAPKEASKTAFSGLGSIASATAIRQMTEGPLRYAGGALKNWLISSAYVSGMGKLITNRVFDAEGSALLANALIASEPFLRNSNEAFGRDITRQFVQEAKSLIDEFVLQLNDSPEGRRRQANRQFIQGQQVPMQMGVGR